MISANCALETRIARVADTEENFKACPCFNCPTHNQCMKEKGEKLYCARGKSACDIVRAGCLCGQCSVASKYLLSSNYYCSDGEAKF